MSKLDIKSNYIFETSNIIYEILTMGMISTLVDKLSFGNPNIESQYHK